MLKCPSRCLPPVRVRPFLIILIIALSLHAETASAVVERSYDTEYEGRNVPVSKIQKGAVLVSVYIKSQMLQFSLSEPINTQPLYDLPVHLRLPAIAGATPSNPGCIPYGYVSYTSFLRYDASGVRESVCSGREVIALKGLRLHYASGGIGPGNRRISTYTISVPRKKLFDIVVNNPEIIISTFSGRNFIIPYESISEMSVINDETNELITSSFNPVTKNATVFIGAIQPAVFFPLQNSSSALLPLPVRPSGGTDLATGSASVDLCLYDGAGLTTSRYMLTFQDQNAASTSPYFAVYNNSGTGKMDYTVSLTDPTGTPQPVTNRTPFFWSNMQNGGAAQSRLKYVQLPDGIQGTVPCVPSVVTVKVKPVPYKSLRAGNYTGHLNILFTPSTG